MSEFEAVIKGPDEEGWCAVDILGPGYEKTYDIRGDQVDQWVEQELAILNHPQRDETCPHGLSAALCSGPEHY